MLSPTAAPRWKTQISVLPRARAWKAEERRLAPPGAPRLGQQRAGDELRGRGQRQQRHGAALQEDPPVEWFHLLQSFRARGALSVSGTPASPAAAPARGRRAAGPPAPHGCRDRAGWLPAA